MSIQKRNGFVVLDLFCLMWQSQPRVKLWNPSTRGLELTFEWLGRAVHLDPRHSGGGSVKMSTAFLEQ